MKSSDHHIIRHELIGHWLSRIGLDMDQRLSRCLEFVGSICLDDSHILQGLIELNSSVVGKFDLELPSRTETEGINWLPYYKAFRRGELQVSEMQPEAANRDILSEAARIALSRDAKFLGTRDFLMSLSQFISGKLDTEYPITSEALLYWSLKNTKYSPKNVVQYLYENGSGDEDLQYIMTFDKQDRISIRPISWLGDYTQDSAFGARYQRVFLTHYSDSFGIIHQSEIDELEFLINKHSTTEQEFQRFFENYPRFFGFWDYKEIHPHVYLSTDGDKSLIPDFVLTDNEIQKAMILELKLPSPRIVRNQPNRDRFTAIISEARAQLMSYKEYFRSASNRNRLTKKLGMEVYEPHLAVLIGRSNDFACPYDRQRLNSHLPDVDIVTYDDILTHAKRRRLLIEPTYTDKLHIC